MCAAVALNSIVPSDESIVSFLQELQNINDNAVLEEPVTPDSKKRKIDSMQHQEQGWVLKPSADCPVVTWVENGHVFTVQNPNNCGSVLLKMEIYKGADTSHPTHLAGVYLDESNEVYSHAMDLAMRLENMWVDRVSGIPKVGGLTQTMMKVQQQQEHQQPPIHCSCKHASIKHRTTRSRSTAPQRKKKKPNV